MKDPLLTVYALHGFLGSKSDWDLFSAKDLGVDRILSLSLPPKKKLFPKTDRNILMGYSLGGRIALQLLAEKSFLCKAAVIISAHPGLSNSQEKIARLKNDEAWTNRFLSEPWEPLLNAWNSQLVFQGSISLPRQEPLYDRKELASLLKTYSLGLQEDQRKNISILPIPLLWIVGERDASYKTLAQSLTFAHPKSQITFLAESGHRAPWDQPALFQKTVSTWIENLCI